MADMQQEQLRTISQFDNSELLDCSSEILIIAKPQTYQVESVKPVSSEIRKDSAKRTNSRTATSKLERPVLNKIPSPVRKGRANSRQFHQTTTGEETSMHVKRKSIDSNVQRKTLP